MRNLSPYALLAQAPLALIAVALVIVAFEFGGYHPRAWGWVGVAALAWAAVEAVRGRLPALRSPAGIALAAGAGLTVWSAASISWAAFSRHLAWDETNRTLMYLATAAVGTALLAHSRRFSQGATWIGGALATVGAITVGQLRFADEPLPLFVAGRLDAPLGYSNALAALYVIGAWLLIGASCAAAQRYWQARQRPALSPIEHDMVRRGMLQQREHAEPSSLRAAAWSGLLLAGAGGMVCLVLLAQSRGALLAGAGSIVIAFIAMPTRAALAARLGGIAVVVGLVADALARPFVALGELTRVQREQEGSEAVAQASASAIAAVHAAAGATIGATVALFAIGAALVVVPAALHRHTGNLRLTRTARMALIGVLAVAGGTVVAVFAAQGTSPVQWLSVQYRGCLQPERFEEDPAEQRSHFADAGTNRCDFWRVAIDNFRENPIRGVGANNFQGPYVLKRESGEEPRQAHSLPLQMIGELGIVGAALFAVIAALVIRAALAYARSGGARDATFAGAITAMAYWAAHASLDWLWNMPVVTLPMALLAGGLVACVSAAQERLPRAAAVPIALGVLLIGAVSLVPPTMADLRLRQAREPATMREQPQVALAHAREARQWDPTWAAPPLQEGALLAALGERQAAAAAIAEAVSREPDHWSVRFRAARVYAAIEMPGRAARELAAARKLNPALERE